MVVDKLVPLLILLATTERPKGETEIFDRNYDSFDIRNYLKVTTIPGGTISDSVYIYGLTFKVNHIPLFL